MAINHSNKRGGIRPSLRNGFYSYERAGQEIVSAWPPKRKEFMTVHQKNAQELFRQACKAMKLHHADFQIYAADNVKGTPFLPRDALAACFYGKGPTLYCEDGTRVVPMANRVNMSDLLDNLGWEYGSILVRDKDIWRALAPGNPGQILMMDEEYGVPVWKNAPESGGSSHSVVYWSFGLSVQAINVRGVAVRPLRDIELTGVYVMKVVSPTVPEHFLVAEVDGSGVILSVLLDMEIDQSGPGGSRFIRDDIYPSLPLEKGRDYVLAYYQPTRGGTDNHELGGVGTSVASFPVWQNLRRVRGTINNPHVGSTLAISSSPPDTGFGVDWR